MQSVVTLNALCVCVFLFLTESALCPLIFQTVSCSLRPCLSGPVRVCAGMCGTEVTSVRSDIRGDAVM